VSTWIFEPGHTEAEFRARHMMVTWVRGLRRWHSRTWERTGAIEYYLPEAECPPELSRGG
jgi:hypothetical protein